MTRNDLELSYQALSRMLDDYNTKMSNENKPKMFSRFLTDILSNTPSPETEQPPVPVPEPVPVPVSPALPPFVLVQGRDAHGSKITPLDIIEGNTDGSTVMETVMSNYEKDLKHPVQGMIFGSLMSSMLIQVWLSE